MYSKNQVVVVDRYDHQLGTMELIDAHREGRLHRSVSVFLFDPEGRWLMQRRGTERIHSPGLWSNTCCAHPFFSESADLAAYRRLFETTGISDVRLQLLFTNIRHDVVSDDLVEHELDHIYVGVSRKVPLIQDADVGGYTYFETEDLFSSIQRSPELFLPWIPKSVRSVTLASASHHFIIQQ